MKSAHSVIPCFILDSLLAGKWISYVEKKRGGGGVGAHNIKS